MNAAVAMIRICSDRLLLCKQKFDALTQVVARLQQTLGALQKLIADRANEARLQGKIQNDLNSLLATLCVIIDRVLDEETKTVEKAKQFCCFRLGPAGLLSELEFHDEELRDLLALAESGGAGDASQRR
jgi:hypothetical protein